MVGVVVEVVVAGWRNDRSQIEGSRQEPRHLTSGHVVIGAEVGVRRRIATKCDPSVGHLIDTRLSGHHVPERWPNQPEKIVDEFWPDQPAGGRAGIAASLMCVRCQRDGGVFLFPL